MKVGEQPVDDAKRDNPGVMKSAVSRRTRPQAAVRAAPPTRARAGSSCRRRRRGRRAHARRAIAATVAARQRVPLRVHPVPREVFVLHRLEGAGADVQRDERALRRRVRRAPPASSSSKCSPAVGAATAPGVARVDRLVAVAIGGAPRRGRCTAAAAPRRAARATRAAGPCLRRQAEEAIVAFDHVRARTAGKLQHRAGLRRVARAHLRPGLARRRRCARPAARPCRRSTSAPNTRALMTRVSLNTTRSPAREQRRQVGERAIARGACRRTCSSRLAERGSAGTCAISSGGSSNAKSDSV